jgi:hypothetical protein
MATNSASLFSSKLKNIHTVLMQAHKNTHGFTSPVQGDERETVIRELLRLVLPMSYRLGKGSIVDAKGAETGQVDAVFEKPFSLSFPVSSEQNRLYLADNVAAAFEIKSDLYAQSTAAKEKVVEIKRLRREPERSKEHGVVMYDELFIPTFIVGFCGYKTVDSMYKTFIPDARSADSVNAILNIESGTFVGRTPARYENGKEVSKSAWYEQENNPQRALLMFFDCLSNTLRHRVHAEVDLLKFGSLLK